MPFIPCPPLARFQFTPLREGRRRKHLSCTQVSRFFQFTPLREGRHEIQKAGRIKVRKFQFTPLREGRRWSGGGYGVVLYFNSRPSARGDALISGVGHSAHHFNSRPSARGDHILSNVSHHVLHFNSRPSARGDGGEKAMSSLYNIISIHAPP